MRLLQVTIYGAKSNNAIQHFIIVNCFTTVNCVRFILDTESLAILLFLQSDTAAPFSRRENADVSPLELGEEILLRKRFANLRVSKSENLKEMQEVHKNDAFLLDEEILLSLTHLAARRELHQRRTTRRAAPRQEKKREVVRHVSTV